MEVKQIIDDLINLTDSTTFKGEFAQRQINSLITTNGFVYHLLGAFQSMEEHGDLPENVISALQRALSNAAKTKERNN